MMTGYHNILVSTYVPDLFETEMARPSIGRRGAETFAPISLRCAGQTDEIPALVAFLASLRDSFMTSEAVAADRGKYVIQNPMKP